jgi:hypothetical protein
MIDLFRLALSRSGRELQLREFRDRSEVFFVNDRDDEHLVYVPRVHTEAFQQCFPKAKRAGSQVDAPILWTFGCYLASQDPRAIQRISAHTAALHAQVAIAIRRGHEVELVRYGFGWRKQVPGFYVEIDQKDFLFTVIGPTYDTRDFLNALYRNNPDWKSFLEHAL